MVGNRRFSTRRGVVRWAGVTTLGLLASCTPAAPPAATPAPKPTAAAKTAAPAPPTVAEPAKPAAAKPTTVPTVRTFTPASITIMNLSTNKAKALDELARDRGYYQQFGLNVTTQDLSDGTKIIAGVVSGSADLGANIGLTPIFPAVAQGAALKIIAGATTKPNYVVYVNDPGIKTLKDLEGKEVGTGPPGAILNALMVAVLKKNRVDAGKVTFVNAGSSTDIYRAVAARKVVAGISQVDFYPSMAKDGVSAITELWKELPEYTTSGLITSDQAIAEKREVLVRVLAAWGQAYRFMRNPESVGVYVSILKKLGASEEEGRFAWQWLKDNQGLAYDVAMTEQQVAYTQQVHVEAGSQPSIVPFEKVADMSLARDALRLMTVQ